MMARSAVAARAWFFGSSLARRIYSCTTPTGSASCGIAGGSFQLKPSIHCSSGRMGLRSPASSMILETVAKASVTEGTLT
eukprot:9334177-Ditylum_brightwellii.AAC.1